MFPIQALTTQKRFMRRFMRKPRTMKIRTYKNRVCDMNNMLARFPPDFNDAQMLEEAELLVILQFGVPRAWQTEMMRQGFDPVAPNKTLQDLVEFCERLELVEDLTSEQKQASTQADGQIGKTGPSGVIKEARKLPSKSSRGEAQRFKRSSSQAQLKTGYDPNKFCELHQRWGHDLAGCNTMRDQAKKMRTSWETSKIGTTPGDRARKQQHDDKTLQAYVQNLVDSAMKQKQAKRKKNSSEQHVHYADGDAKRESKKHYDSSDDDDNDDDYSQTFAALLLDSKISESSSFA